MAHHRQTCLLVLLCAVLTAHVTAVLPVGVPLESWMGHLQPVISDATLLDLTLVGSHDSTTFDLSDSFADNVDGLPSWVNKAIHVLEPTAVGEFIRQQSVTQTLTLPQQLDSGIRFIDLRITYTRPPRRQGGVHSQGSPPPYDWYCAHTLESARPASAHLADLHGWLVAHPTEVVVVWITRHSDSCAKGEAQYPGSSPAQRQRFWGDLVARFGSLLVDHATTSLNATSYAELVRRGQRLAVFAADWLEFTGGSTHALDACAHMQVFDPPAGITNGTGMFQDALELFRDAPRIVQRNKQENKWWQMFLSTSGPTVQIVSSLALHALPHSRLVAHECAKSFHIPGCDRFCPASLLAVSTLTNYYTQRLMEFAWEQDLRMPHALYFDGVGVDGTLALDSDPALPGHTACAECPPPRYGVVATVLSMTVRRLCARAGEGVGPDAGACDRLQSALHYMRGRAPYSPCDCAAICRTTNWPPLQ